MDVPVACSGVEESLGHYAISAKNATMKDWIPTGKHRSKVNFMYEIKKFKSIM
jgi:hypothetical protein